MRVGAARGVWPTWVAAKRRQSFSTRESTCFSLAMKESRWRMMAWNCSPGRLASLDRLDSMSGSRL